MVLWCLTVKTAREDIQNTARREYKVKNPKFTSKKYVKYIRKIHFLI